MARLKGHGPAIFKKIHDAIKAAMHVQKSIEVRNRFNMVERYMDTVAYAQFQLELFEKEKK